MEYVWGALGATFLAGAGALIWYIVRRWGKNEDLAHEIDAERDKAVADAAEVTRVMTETVLRAKLDLNKAVEALRLATTERDALRVEIERVKEQRDRILRAAADKDPRALGDAIRDQLRALEAMRNLPRVPDTDSGSGEGEGAVHGTAPRRTP